MNVTYLIGNGFDLGIGLKTCFTDFLEYYLSVKSDDKDINDFKDTVREETIELWADLELRFGQYIRNFAESDMLNYIKIYEDMLFNLNKYLNEENKKIIDDIGDDNRVKIINDIVKLDTPSIREAIFNDIVNTGYFDEDNSIIFNFITFNYTTTLDRILNDITNRTNNQIYIRPDKNAFHKIENIVHVHGQLDNNTIFGVNDINQLCFPGTVPDKIIRRVVKPLKTSLLGYRVNTQCQEIIEKSDIICIYGMSIGETDAIWWQKIGHWLIHSHKGRVMCFVYNKDIDYNSIFGIDNMLDAEFDYRNRFIKISKFPEDFRNIFEQRFHVIINPNFMQINLVKEETKNKTTV